MTSDVTHQPSTISPSHHPAAITTTTAEDPADEVTDFQFLGCMSGFYSKSKTVILQLSRIPPICKQASLTGRLITLSNTYTLGIWFNICDNTIKIKVLEYLGSPKKDL